jgi:hypothetical protein
MKFSKGEIICRDDLAYPEGALVCDGYDGAGRLLAHALGGGFQLTVPAQDEPRFRAVPDGERGAALFYKGRFTLADAEAAFDAWSNGELWNGWAMPRLERAEAERVLARLGDQRARFDGERDAFVTMSQDGEQEVWGVEVITIADGSRIKAYPVGAGAWTWEEA